MGIPGFNSWFSERYRKAYVPLGGVRVDHLYIDLNSVLHTVMRRAKSHNHFHKLLHKRLHQIFDTMSPTKSVMIAVDGPAPLAKLLTQRDRRKKTGRTIDEGETLTGAAITPGTTFMLDLTHSLTYFCCTKLASRRFRNLVIELSDGTVMGEGEVKVLGRLARPWYPGDQDDTHVLLGDDADLILMALTSYKENLFVANSGLNDNKLDARTPVFSVNLLHRQWAERLVANIVAAGQVPLPSALLHAKLDLTLIAILGKGNDYLPGVRGANMEGPGNNRGLWPIYQNIVKFSTAADTDAGVGANTDTAAFDGSPVDAAPKAAGTDGKGSGKRVSNATLSDTGSITSVDPVTGAPRLDVAALAKLLRLTKERGDSGGGDTWLGTKTNADPQLYLQGCVWLLQMYLTGQCPDYRFYYDGVAPTTGALIKACDNTLAAGHRHITTATFGTTDPRATQPLLPVACALALLPRKCQHLAVPCVRHLMAGPGSAPASEALSINGEDEGEGGGAGTETARGGEAGLEADVYYELYGVCEECNRYTPELARLSKAIAAGRHTQTIMRKRLTAVQGGTAPFNEETEEQLQAHIDKAAAECEAAVSDLKVVERRRKDHISHAHPYRRFPVEQLEVAAEAAVASGQILPEERPSTMFGRPRILRAFDNRQAAFAFLQSPTATPMAPATSGVHTTAAPVATAPWQSSGPVRHMSTSSASSAAAVAAEQQHSGPVRFSGAGSGDNGGLFTPPPPPFIVKESSYFPAIVRQEVLNDEYGSDGAMSLQVAPGGPGEFVRYLAADGEELGAVRVPDKPGQQRQMPKQRQVPSPQPLQQPPRKRHEAKPPAAVATATVGAAAAVAAVNAGAAATAAGVTVSGSRGKSVAVAVAVASPPGQKRARGRGAKNKPNQEARAPDGAGVRGSAGGAGGPGGGGPSAIAVAAMGSTDVAVQVPRPLSASACPAGAPPPPPMPSGWLMSTAAAAAATRNQGSWQTQMQPQYQQHEQQQRAPLEYGQYGRPPACQTPAAAASGCGHGQDYGYGFNPSYGGVDAMSGHPVPPLAPQSYQPPYSMYGMARYLANAPQHQQPGFYAVQRPPYMPYGVNQGYGGPAGSMHVPARPMAPSPYRPPSPTSVRSAAAASAAAAAVPGRGRAPAAPGPRW